MGEAQKSPRRSGFLEPYRVLDLSDERGLLAGWMLARLGADVIQVEPRGGSRARRAGPLVEDWPAGRNSLYWSAYAAGKRGLSCNLDDSSGRELFGRLLAHADILIETAAPGEALAPGLDRASIAALNPRLIHVSITPYGGSGPKARYADSELTVWASAGTLSPSRDQRGVPLRISVPQAYLHGAADAAAAALIALFARHRSGRGQHIDVSAQDSASVASLSTTLAAAVGHNNFQMPSFTPGKEKQFDLSGSGSRTRRSKWRVADGLLEFNLGMGPASGGSSNNLFAWMRESGALSAEFDGWDWIKLPDRIKRDEVDVEQIERARTAVAEFLRPYSKHELMRIALQRSILMAPAMTVGDLVGSEQLQNRGLFERIEQDGHTITLPARFAAGCDHGFAALRPAPAIGEHNAEILDELLGLAPSEVAALSRAGAI